MRIRPECGRSWGPVRTISRLFRCGGTLITCGATAGGLERARGDVYPERARSIAAHGERGVQKTGVRPISAMEDPLLALEITRAGRRLTLPATVLRELASLAGTECDGRGSAALLLGAGGASFELAAAFRSAARPAGESAARAI